MVFKSHVWWPAAMTLLGSACGGAVLTAAAEPAGPSEAERAAVAALVNKGAMVQIDANYRANHVVLTSRCTNEDLPHLTWLESLTRLQIASPSINDEGFGHLLGLTNLTSMIITQSGISENGMSALRTALPNCRILTTMPSRGTTSGPGSRGPAGGPGGPVTGPGAGPGGAPIISRGPPSGTFGVPGGPTGPLRLGPPALGLSSLAANQAVQSDLELTAEQKEKVSAATDMAAVRRAQDEKVMALLSPTQQARLKQIELQEAGARGGLVREEVAKELGLSDKERDAIRKAVEEANAKLPRSMSELSGKTAAGQSPTQALADLQKQAEEQVLALLNAEQRQKWDGLVGPKGPDLGRSGITFGAPPGSTGSRRGAK